MLKKTIKYEDFNGLMREEEFMFGYTKAELMEMQMSMSGGLEDMLRKIIATQDIPSIGKWIRKIILDTYGEKSIDGKHFLKFATDGHRLADDFAQTEAYSVLFMELMTNEVEAAKFVKGILPSDIAKMVEEQEAKGNAAIRPIN